LNLPPCHRCGDHEPKDQGEYDSPDEEEYSLLLVEVQLTNGIAAWLCCDCRTEWLEVNNSNIVRIQQNRLRFKLETMEDILCRHPYGGQVAARVKEVEELTVFWDEIMAMEPEIDRFAKAFLSNRASGL